MIEALYWKLEKMYFYIAMIMIFHVLTKTQGKGCRSLNFLDCTKNKTLANHTIKSFRVLSPGLEICQHYCFLNEVCVSYNMGPIEGIARTCELSDTDHVAHPDHVIPRAGYSYCAVKNPCSSNSCPLGSICRPDLNMDSYECSVCQKSLGLEDGTIPNASINASSIYGPGKEAWRGRLHNFPAKPYNVNRDVGAWIAAKFPRKGEYIQIDLGRITTVTMVATQGRPRGYDQWVRGYTLQYSKDGKVWGFYFENREKKIFRGNSDRNTVQTNVLMNPILARYVRIVPNDWKTHIALRAELYGCP